MSAQPVHSVPGAGFGLAAGVYTADANDASGGQLDIDTGFVGETNMAQGGGGEPSVVAFVARVLRSNVDVTADAVLTVEDGRTIRVADGGATYSVTAGDEVHWFAFGRR